MEERIERENTKIGYVWANVGEDYYLRNGDNDLKRISANMFRLVELLADDEIMKDELDGKALQLVEQLEAEGYISPNAPVIQLVQPDDVPILPQAGLFVVLLGLGVYAAVLQWKELGPALGMKTTDQLLLLGGLVIVSIVIHEMGHYLAGRTHLDPSLRLGTVNGVIPAVITDTTGGWMLPRNRRLWISLGGPLVELVWMVGVLAVHYFLLPDSVVLGALVVIIVGQVVASINPLIHGDGYWFLMDALRIKSLRSRGIDDLRKFEPTLAAGYVLLSYGFGVCIALMLIVSVVDHIGLIGPILQTRIATI